MGQQYENVIVMGKSGAGKQPRVDVLIRHFGLTQLSTGDIFRKYLGTFKELDFQGDLNEFRSGDGFIPDAEIAEKLGGVGPDAVLGLKATFFVNQGLFVPDEITNALFEAAFETMDFRGAAIDGFPRTVDQAKYLVELLQRKDVKIDAILLIENEDELIINRTLDRRICKNCGELYHMEFRPPPADGKCENCGSDQIVQRSDDNIESLKKRLSEFREKTVPAIDFLKEAGIPFYAAPGNLPDYSPKRVETNVFEVLGIDPATLK